ncbi:hypothetical protein AB0H42_33015 [Nocardia sp. NPDC050799]|uniref:hypothetical protein n=1 Tax=Nocardia sp. NPDC050799 TaxID=3154842 RepID=UPI0033E5D937
MTIARLIRSVPAVVAVTAALTALAGTPTHHLPAGDRLQFTHHTAPLATPSCPQVRTPERISGTGPGGTVDGPDAILAFHHAYYALRSASAARAVVTIDAQVPSAADIQAGIDSLPADTRYCVHVAPAPYTTAGQQRWCAELAQQYPGAPETILRQAVTTRTDGDGRALITAITTP